MCAVSVSIPVSFIRPSPVSFSHRGSDSDFARCQSDLPSHRNEVDFNALPSHVSVASKKDEGRRPPERRVQYSEIAMKRKTGGEMGGRGTKWAKSA